MAPTRQRASIERGGAGHSPVGSVGAAAGGGAPWRPGGPPEPDGACGAIERAALALLDEGGIGAVTVRAVAARAHYHRSSVMYHIGCIESLHRRLWSRSTRSLWDHVLGGRDGDTGWLAAATDGLCDFAATHPHRAALIGEQRLGEFELTDHHRRVLREVFGVAGDDEIQAVALRFLFAQLAAAFTVIAATDDESIHRWMVRDLFHSAVTTLQRLSAGHEKGSLALVS